MINLNYNVIGAGYFDRYSLEEAKGFIPFQIQYIIVPGGGGAAGGNNQIVSPKVGIAGNAGVVKSGSYCVQPLTDYPIVVGLGGAGGPKGTSGFAGQNGGTSSFNADIVADGGLGGVSQTYLTGSTFAGNGSGASASADLGGNGNQWTYNLPGPFPNPLIPGGHGGQYISESYYGGGGAGLNVSGSPLPIQYIIVGGGGGGMNNTDTCNSGKSYGGGGAAAISGSFILEPQVKTYPITIGAGGIGKYACLVESASNGQNSSAFNIIGGGGQGAYGGNSGGNSGTGSIGLLLPFSGSQAGAGAAQNASGTNGGNGLQWVDGNYYAGGGYGGTQQGGGSYGTYGQTTLQYGYYPGRGGAGIPLNNYSVVSNGDSGSVVLRYPGTGSKATGGTITYDAGTDYTYHTFTASGNLVLNTYEPTVASGLPGLGGGGYANGTGSANTGGGAGASFYNYDGARGGDGFVAIRYEGLPIAEGGEITITDNYTYHTFTASAIFSAKGQESNVNINPCPGTNTIVWKYEAKTQGDGLTAPNTLVYGTSSIYTAGVSSNVAVSQSANGQFISELIVPVTASLSGSGKWPTTGSNVMQIEVTNDYYFSKFAGLNMSAAQGNMNLSGSILEVDFLAGEGTSYYISSSIVHTKGNIYNPAVNWRTENNSPLSTTNLINGYTASFNVVKNSNEPLVSVPTVTGSKASTFQNDYAFNITSSLTASVNNVTGSTTMSILIPEAGISYTKIFSNPATTTALLTASFAASTNAPYNVTASVVMNKGNISNSNINWRTSGSNSDGKTGISASFTIFKNATEGLIDITNLLDDATSTFKNAYAFNITASLSGSFTSSWASSNSSSFSTAQWLFAIPELGYSILTNSASINLSKAFEAQTSISDYNITASINSFIVSGGLVEVFTKRSGVIYEQNLFAAQTLPLSPTLIYTSSFDKPGNFTALNPSVTGGFATSSLQTITNLDNNFFPYPYKPTFNVSDSEFNNGDMKIAYWGLPKMAVSGGAVTSYNSGSNITIHYLTNGTTAEFSSSVTPTTASHLLAETMTVGGGGRGGVKDIYFDILPSGREYIFAGGGGAGGYVLANNYFKKGSTFNIVVGDGAARYDGVNINPISGSDSYIYSGSTTLQLSKGGGNGGAVTGSYDAQGQGGRAGGSGGGASYVYGPQYTQGGGGSITGSVNNIFEQYGAFDGFGGGTAYTPFYPTTFPVYATAGGGGGASQEGQSNPVSLGTAAGLGGLGKYDLSFTMKGVAGGGAGANCQSNPTASMYFGGGDSQRYGISGSITACDGVDGTGGGGGGLISGSYNGYPTNAPTNYTTKGGSGKVQIRYQSATPLATGGTIESGSISGSLFILHTFTSSGTFTTL